MDLGLKGKRALVLAASRGLGYACARGLAQEGCQLVICSRDEARIRAAADQIRKDTGAKVEALTAERDSLKSRLSAARSRVDALLERLPEIGTPT